MSPRANPRVLAVDQDPDACARVFDCFERARWPVFAATPPEALRTVQAVRPDLLVSELDLDGLSGLDLLRRARRYRPRLRSIFLSRRAGWRLLQDVVTAGGDDLLQKPIAERDLLHSARRLVRRERPAITETRC